MLSVVDFEEKLKPCHNQKWWKQTVKVSLNLISNFLQNTQINIKSIPLVYSKNFDRFNKRKVRDCEKQPLAAVVQRSILGVLVTTIDKQRSFEKSSQ